MPTTRLHERAHLPRPVEEVFAFVADFSNLASWDPGIAESRRLDEGHLGVGSEFEVVAEFRDRRLPMRYRITQFEPPRRVVLEGSGESLTAVDDIRFEPADGGTTVDYRADLRLRGVAGLAQPLLTPLLQRIGREAIGGLEAALG